MQKVALIHSLKIRQASLFGKSELEVNDKTVIKNQNYLILAVPYPEMDSCKSYSQHEK